MTNYVTVLVNFARQRVSHEQVQGRVAGHLDGCWTLVGRLLNGCWTEPAGVIPLNCCAFSKMLDGLPLA